MNTIELDIWEPVPDKPGIIRYVEGRPAEDVYVELKQRLADSGFLPDEYFLLGHNWRGGRKIPKNAWLYINVDYGANEGIYMDIDLCCSEDLGAESSHNRENFITGKTLRESHSALDRMHLIASAVRKAFHTDGIHARYVIIGGNASKTSDMVTHLSADEIQLMVDSLIDTRAKQKSQGQPYELTEQLLRRFLGSITEYMQSVGERPIGITDQDMIVLSVRENNIEAFQELLPKVPELHTDLLVDAAGQSGRIGESMTKSLLGLVKNAPRELYLQAITRAVMISDVPRISMLLEGASDRTDDADGTLCGEAINIAIRANSDYVSGMGIARELARKAQPGQLAMANPYIITSALRRKDESFAHDLIRCGVDFSGCQAEIYYTFAQSGYTYKLRDLDNRGGDINAQDFGALRLCLKNCDINSALTLIEYGGDYAGFRAMVDGKYLSSGAKLFLEAMDNHLA